MLALPLRALLSVREKEYVEAARAIASGHTKIIVRHILPNALGAIVVSATLNIGAAILAESTLSYLGLGIGPPIASWRSTLFHAQQFDLDLERVVHFQTNHRQLDVVVTEFQIERGAVVAVDPGVRGDTVVAREALAAATISGPTSPRK